MVHLAVCHAEKDEAVPVSRPAGRRRAALATLAFAVTGLAVLPVAPAAASSASSAATGPALTIYAGGDRTGDTAVAGLAGETFTVYSGTSGSVGAPVGGCTTGADGACVVPVRAVAAGGGYWVAQTSVPDGWLANPLPNYSRDFVAGPIAGSQQVAVPVAAPNGTSGTARGSLWAASRDDPPLPAGCGLKVALLFDLSATTASLRDLKAAGYSLVTALIGTPSSVGVYTFGTATVAGDGNLGLTPVSTAGSAATVNAKISALSGTPSGAANWDQGLWQIASDPTRYNLALVLTDGGGPPARFVDAENAIFSANALKAKGTRIVAIGAGTAGATDSGAAADLASISGPVAGTDYYLTNPAALAGLLTNMADAECAGTVNVTTKVVPASTPRDLGAALPAPGWHSTASWRGVQARAATGDDSGTVSFASSSGAATVAQTTRPGYRQLRQRGKNATCRDSGGDPVSVTDAATGPGFTVAAKASQAVSCVVYDQEENGPDPASVDVHDTWVVDGVSSAGGDQDPDFQSQLFLARSDTDGAPTAWGQESDGYVAGGTVDISEQDVTVPPGCAVSESGDLGAEPLAPGANSFSITNTVECTGDASASPSSAVTTVPSAQELAGRTELTLVKEISDPFTGVQTVPLTSWRVTARPEVGGADALTGDAGLTGLVAPNTPYLLTESSVPGYQQTVDPAVTRLAAGATGSWQCVDDLPGGATGLEDFDGGTGIVVLQPGQHVTCTAVNLLERAIPVGAAATGGGFAATNSSSWVTASGLALIAAGALVGTGGLCLRRRGGA
jgi:hypothetical protein